MHNGSDDSTSVQKTLCASRQALDLISDRWTLIVVKALAEGTHRYGALHRAIDGISQKMLTQTLRSLERDGLFGGRSTRLSRPRSSTRLHR